TFTLVIPTQAIDSVSVSLRAFRAGQALKSSTKDVVVFPLLEARSSYSSTLDVANDDFDLVNFTFAQPPGFQNGALHSPHPYPDNSNPTAFLRIPIIVASEGAILRYNDVALVEPGSPGVGFGNANFFDFVVVEASNDNGGTWRPLADGYDARFDPAVWLAAFSNNQPGDASMFRTHEINLLDTFPPGEEILIRFRLFADQFVNGWGWVIDDLEIQSEVTSVAADEPLPRVFSLAQNYPNPFNPTTTIRYALPRSADVRLTIYNLLGQQIRTLVDGRNQAAGFHSVQWDGKDDRGGLMPSGIYVYRIQAGDFKKSRKMLLVK
ncbi:MAG: T9SS C-terminal target domain-containing protein, partial [Calditrichaeota bacterium]